jgi:hypothetical protein
MVSSVQIAETNYWVTGAIWTLINSCYFLFLSLDEARF